MAPKKRKGESSAAPPPPRPFNSQRFVSADAEDRFTQVLAGRALVPERGLRPEEDVDGEMWDMIVSRGWDSFTDHPDSAVTAIVHEFYANAKDTPDCEVLVRGQLVSFRREVINEFYNLRAPDYCKYASYVAAGPKYDEIIRDLCQPGTEWAINKYTNELKSFPFKCLSRYGKIWYAFLCAKLMPSTHMTEVTRQRAVLLYAIITGLDINVGIVIESSIRRNLQGALTGGLPHPSLITALCRKAGVRWSKNETIQPPTTLLDHQLIARYKVWEGGESHPRGLGFILTQDPAPTAERADDDNDDDGDNQSGPAPTSSSGGTTHLIKKLRKRIDTQLMEVIGMCDRIARRQEAMHEYTYTCSSALAAHIASMNPQAAPFQMPPPPPLPVYPPPEDANDYPNAMDDDDAEDDDDDDDDDM